MAIKTISNRQINGLALRRQLGRIRPFEISGLNFQILTGRDKFLESGQVAQRVEARVFAGFGQEVVGGGIGRQPFGAQVECGLQILQCLGSFAKNGVQRREVVMRFGLIGSEADEFLEQNFEFGHVTQLGGNLGHGSRVRVMNVRIGQCLVEQSDGVPEQFNRMVGLLDLIIEARQFEGILEIRRVSLQFSLHSLHLGLKLGLAGSTRFVVLKVFDEVKRLAIVRIELEIGLGNNQGVVQALELEQEIDVPKDGFRAVRTKRKGLLEGEIGFA